MVTIHLLIKGKVQGVYYRATAQDKAFEIGVRGWIKNTKEGNVEAMVSGTEDQVEQFIEWCRKGPKRAVVTDVLVMNKEYEPFSDFRIIK